MIVLMSNPAAFARSADALESCNHAPELTARALAAVQRAVGLAALLAFSCEGVDLASRGALEACRDLLREDLVRTRDALGEAARLLDAADPLGCVDTSPAHEALTLARGEYHAALATLHVDPLSLAA